MTLTVDASRRAAVARNHSAVHLLDAALRDVLGTHIRQAGSYVDDKEARFDFTHFAAVTPEELARVEMLVNEKILDGIPVSTLETDVESAKKSGAIALFGEKYGNIVRVVKMGDFSAELCGGTHVDNTAKIGLFKITMESSVAAGTRRITAVSGFGSYQRMIQEETLISSAMKTLKAGTSADVLIKIAALTDDLKTVRKELEGASAKLASAKAASMLAAAVDVMGIKVASMQTELPVPAARLLGDDLKARYPDMTAVIASDFAGKLTLLCICGKNAVEKESKLPTCSPALPNMSAGEAADVPTARPQAQKSRKAFRGVLSASGNHK